MTPRRDRQVLSTHYVQEMGTRTTNWSISTREGLSLDSEELVNALAVHQRRLIDTWCAFTPSQWTHQSRNKNWTVHHTVRHVADGMERVTAVLNDDPLLDIDDFDPLSTPQAWLASSVDEPPAATIDRFAAASARFRRAVSARLASGDNSQGRTVYGTAHWTVNVVHVLWDSWLHERDVLLPLGHAAPSSEAEQRLVGLYGVLMALAPSMLAGQSLSSTIQLTGISVRIIEVSCEPGSLRSAEVPTADVVSAGALPAAIDALAGRGNALADALPGAPEELGLLGALFNS